MRRNLLSALAGALMHAPGMQQTLSLVTVLKAPVVIGPGVRSHKRLVRGWESANGRYLTAADAARAMRRYDRFIKRNPTRKAPQWMLANAKQAIRQFRGVS